MAEIVSASATEADLDSKVLVHIGSVLDSFHRFDGLVAATEKVIAQFTVAANLVSVTDSLMQFCGELISFGVGIDNRENRIRCESSDRNLG